MTEPLASLLQASHLLAPEDLAATVAAHAQMLGAGDTVLYLSDYEQTTLLPLAGAGVPERQELPIEGTLAGRAFRRVEVVGNAVEHGHRMWVPLLDGVETGSSGSASPNCSSPGRRRETSRRNSAHSSPWSPS
jgi:hypothetical protein